MYFAVKFLIMGKSQLRSSAETETVQSQRTESERIQSERERKLIDQLRYAQEKLSESDKLVEAKKSELAQMREAWETERLKFADIARTNLSLETQLATMQSGNVELRGKVRNLEQQLAEEIETMGEIRETFEKNLIKLDQELTKASAEPALSDAAKIYSLAYSVWNTYSRGCRHGWLGFNGSGPVPEKLKQLLEKTQQFLDTSHIKSENQVLINNFRRGISETVKEMRQFSIGRTSMLIPSYADLKLEF